MLKIEEHGTRHVSCRWFAKNEHAPSMHKPSFIWPSNLTELTEQRSCFLPALRESGGAL